MLSRMTLGRLQPNALEKPMQTRMAFGRIAELVAVSDTGDVGGGPSAAAATSANVGGGTRTANGQRWASEATVPWPDAEREFKAPGRTVKINTRRAAASIFAHHRHDRIAAEIGVLAGDDEGD